MNIDDILPIGSIILLRRARKPLMIIGYFANVNENEKKEYIGIPYPEGLVDMSVLRGFNHKDIRSVIQIGNQGNSFLEFKDIASLQCCCITAIALTVVNNAPVYRQ